MFKNKEYKQIYKIYSKLFNLFNYITKHYTFNEYLDRFNMSTICVANEDDTIQFNFQNEDTHKSESRSLIFNTLCDINYRRDGKDWTESTVVAFIDAVFALAGEDCFIVKKSEQEFKDLVSKMFDVPVNRFNTQVALFLRNYENGNSSYNLEDWFTRTEILQWRYRDPENLQADIELEKIKESDLVIIRRLYNV